LGIRVHNRVKSHSQRQAVVQDRCDLVYDGWIQFGRRLDDPIDFAARPVRFSEETRRCSSGFRAHALSTRTWNEAASHRGTMTQPCRTLDARADISSRGSRYRSGRGWWLVRRSFAAGVFVGEVQYRYQGCPDLRDEGVGAGRPVETAVRWWRFEIHAQCCVGERTAGGRLAPRCRGARAAGCSTVHAHGGRALPGEVGQGWASELHP
jgi:hypothetical protein